MHKYNRTHENILFSSWFTTDIFSFNIIYFGILPFVPANKKLFMVWGSEMVKTCKMHWTKAALDKW